jgi:hypothetical protein
MLQNYLKVNRGKDEGYPLLCLEATVKTSVRLVRGPNSLLICCIQANAPFSELFLYNATTIRRPKTSDRLMKLRDRDGTGSHARLGARKGFRKDAASAGRRLSQSSGPLTCMTCGSPTGRERSPFRGSVRPLGKSARPFAANVSPKLGRRSPGARHVRPHRRARCPNAKAGSPN